MNLRVANYAKLYKFYIAKITIFNDIKYNIFMYNTQ